MYQAYLLQFFIFTLLALTLWVVMYPPYRQAFTDWVLYRKRANGIDVSSFEVECVGIEIRRDKIPQREIALLKNAITHNQQMHSLFSWTTTYRGEK